MRKQFIFLLTIAGLLILSCVEENHISGPNSVYDEVYFFPKDGIDKHERNTTRTLSGGNGSEFTAEDFVVFCSTQKHSLFNPFVHNYDWIYKAKMKRIEAGLWCHDGSNGFFTDYWDQKSLHSFFAIAPYSTIANNFEPREQSLKDNISFDYNVPLTDLKGGVDLMYASAINVRGKKMSQAQPFDNTIDFPDGGVVPLQFRHALAQLSFSFQLNPEMNSLLEDTPETIQVKKIEFHNIASRGRMTIDGTGNIAWVLKDTADITWDLSSENIFWADYDGESKLGIPTKDNHIGLLLPQSFQSDSAVLNITTSFGGEEKVKKIMLNRITHLINNGEAIPSVKAGKNYRFIISLMDDDRVEFDFEINHEVEEWRPKEDAYLPI